MREVPSQEAFLARLEQEGLSSYSRDGKLTGVEVDGKKYRFKRTIGVDPESHDWTPRKPNDKEIESKRELPLPETHVIETTPVPEFDVGIKEDFQYPSKEDPVQNTPESNQTNDTKIEKTPSEDLSKTSAMDDPINPHHIQRSSELNSLRVQRKIGRDRDDKDENDGFRR